MTAVIVVTANDPDALIETAGAVGWTTQRLEDGRVRVESSIATDTADTLAADVRALGNRFGVTGWEDAV